MKIPRYISRRFIFVFLVIGIAYLAWIELPMFKPSNWKLIIRGSSERYISPDSLFSFSPLITYNPKNDSLLRCSFLSFEPNMTSVVQFKYSPIQQGAVQPFQSNLSKPFNLYLCNSVNYRGQRLFYPFKVDSLIVGYDYSPWIYTTKTYPDILVYTDSERGVMFRIPYSPNRTITNYEEQPVPIIAGNWLSKNLVYTLSYLKGNSFLNSYNVRKIVTDDLDIPLPQSHHGKQIQSIKGIPQAEEICFFQDLSAPIATIPYKTDHGWQLDIIDVHQEKILQSLKTQNDSQSWYALRRNSSYLDLALVYKDTHYSTLYRYDLSNRTMSKGLNMDFEILDYTTNNDNSLILLSNNKICKLDIKNKIVASINVGNYEKLHVSPYQDNKQMYFISDSQNEQVKAIDSDLQSYGKLKLPKIRNKLKSLHFIAYTLQCKDHTGLMAEYISSDRYQEYGFFTPLECLPRGVLANLVYRIRQLLGKFGSFFSQFVHKYPILTLLYVILTPLAFALSAFIIKRSMQNKISDISSLLPIPQSDAHYVKKVLQLLKKPRLTQAVILNIDIVGFSSLVSANHNNPELLNRILDQFYEVFIEQASSQGGTIGKIMGDGIIAIFGWPDLKTIYENKPHENLDSALQTASYMICAPLVINDVKVDIRMGMTVGSVFIGHYGNEYRRDYLAMGDAIGLSEVIQKNADINTLFVDEVALEALHQNYPEIKLSPKGSARYNEYSVQVYQALLV